MKTELLAAYDRFWMQNPALLYAIAMAAGMLAAFTENPLLAGAVGLFFLFPIFSGNPRLRTRLLLALVVGTSAFAYVTSTYYFPTLDDEGINGTAIFVPETIARSTRNFSKRWLYSGKIASFVAGTELVARNIPATISYREGKRERPSADHAYRIQGRLKRSISGNYFLTTPRDSIGAPAWSPVEFPCNTLCEWRYEAKNSVANSIKRRIADRHSATFLAGIATGSFDDSDMFIELGRFGLQHIMAISGFHFAIIAGILGAALRVVIPQRYSIPLLIFAMSGYFVFLGAGPSVVRAWITIVIALAAFLVNRTSSGLNTLGAAVVLILLYDPLMVRKIGFQFSAMMTLAILLFYPLFNAWMGSFLPKRTPGMAIRMALYDQYGYMAVAFFRSAFALTLAVNLFALPLTLYYFHKFPAMGLLYNLFFPFLVSISMLLLIVGLGLDLLLPVLGGVVHDSNNLFTHFVLNLVYQMPTNIDMMVRVESIPTELVIGILCMSVVMGIVLRQRLENRRISLVEWKYI